MYDPKRLAEYDPRKRYVLLRDEGCIDVWDPWSGDAGVWAIVRGADGQARPFEVFTHLADALAVRDAAVTRMWVKAEV